jgi:iron complex outermembrane receptor protein
MDERLLLLRRVRLEPRLRDHVHVHVDVLRPQDEQDLKNYAVFAHFDWDMTERLSMSGGLRYTDDEKVADILRVTGNTAPPGVGLPQYVLIPNAIVVAESEEWSPKISFDYQFTPTIMG